MLEPKASTTNRVRIWDLPTRLFHWLLAGCVIASVVTAKIGGNAMNWHFRLGLLVMALLLFRIVWGLIGGRWSRFASFLYTPGTVLRYLRGEVRDDERLDVGHSPLGALSVFALLGFLAVQVGTGLVADDEIVHRGPLNGLVGNATALAATAWHKSWGQWTLLALVALHVAAIVYYRVARKTDLVRPMVIGDKPLPATVPPSADGARQRLLAVLLGGACGGVAVWVSGLGA